ncbi:MAG: FliH/SctL family protein [Pseudomonadota bacterium]|nr:FliH/SctL family protein [Pseudomonadota bacterium]
MNQGHKKEIRPFVFEQSFDMIGTTEDVEVVRQEEEEDLSPTFSEEELQEAREVAYKDGLQAGRQETMNSIEQKVSKTLEVVGTTLNRLDEQQHSANELIARETIDLAITAAEKLLPQFIQTVGTKEIETFVGDILSRILEEPRVTVFVAKDLVLDVERNLVNLISKIGFSGAVHVTEDTSLGPVDCRIRWSEGEADRLLEPTRREINAIAQMTPRREAPKLEISAEPLRPENVEPTSIEEVNTNSLEPETSIGSDLKENTAKLNDPHIATDPQGENNKVDGSSADVKQTDADTSSLQEETAAGMSPEPT